MADTTYTLKEHDSEWTLIQRLPMIVSGMLFVSETDRLPLNLDFIFVQPDL